MISSGASTVDFAYVFRISWLTLSRSLVPHKSYLAKILISESQQRFPAGGIRPDFFCPARSDRMKAATSARDPGARGQAKRILVIGDLMLDEFVWGKVGRISPEAPVPVVEVTGESFYPGRRGQCRAQSARIYRRASSVIGMIGTDRGGRQLRELLREQKIDTADRCRGPELSAPS